MKLKSGDVKKAWSRGLNWVVFFAVWFIFAAMIGAIENTTLNTETRNKMEFEAGKRHISSYFESIERKLSPDRKEEKQLLQRMIHLFQKDKLYQIFRQIEHFEHHVQVMTLKIQLMQKHLVIIRDNIPKNDTEAKEVASELLSVLSNPSFITAFCGKEWCNGRENSERALDLMPDEDDRTWSLGHSLHFVSTVFTTLGYGMRSPVTACGKLVTIIMIVTVLPFFVHCVGTTSTNLNRLINRILGVTENYDDLEDLTGEQSTNRVAKRSLAFKGSVVLVGIIGIHLLLSAVYHYATTGWNFGDVLYFEFVSYSTIGFGDMVPEDEISLAGSIAKNILVRIPACILVVTTVIRMWPIIA